MTGAVPDGEVEQAAQRLLLAMTTRSLRGRDHVSSMRDEQDAARDLRKALDATPSPQPVAEVERVTKALEAQMDAPDNDLPSSLHREAGRVWLEGWFDIAAALGGRA